MSKLTFQRSAGAASLQLDEQDPIELSPDQLVEIISALTTEGRPLQIDLSPGVKHSPSAPSPCTVKESMGTLANMEVSPPPSHYFEQPQGEIQVSYTRSAREHARLSGLTDDQALWVMKDPDVEVVMDSGNAAALVRGDIGLKVFLDTDTIFGVYKGDVLRKQIAERSSPADRRRIHGGNGGKHPTTMDDLISALKGKGFKVTLANSGHHHVEDPISGKFVVLPSTPSDHRSLMNNVKMAERELGISLRKQ